MTGIWEISKLNVFRVSIAKHLFVVEPASERLCQQLVWNF